MGKAGLTKMKSLEKAFDNFLVKRVENIVAEKVYNDREYSLLFTSGLELHRELKELLPEESRKLLQDQEDIYSERMFLENYFAYKQGLKDGLRLKKLLSKIDLAKIRFQNNKVEQKLNSPI